MSKITFNIAARCEAAGRKANQDNMWLCADLTRTTDTITPSVVNKDGEVTLGAAGALLVVADGMGGMNAGEVASDLVIKGIRRAFSRIPADILSDEAAVKDFIKVAIVNTDADVKRYAAEHREAEGLGSTIVLVWLLGAKAYCAWVGDSRIYCYNPNNSLVRLSHDHSYVQRLVDEGKITDDEAFEHPDGNIITRSIGDSGVPVVPEIRVYDIHERDLFLLCSDGLCGLLPDNELEEIISLHCSSSKDTLDALWEAGLKTGFSDNCTIQIAAIDEAPIRARGIAQGYPKIAPIPDSAAAMSKLPPLGATDHNVNAPAGSEVKKDNKRLWIMVGVIGVIACLCAWFFFLRGSDSGTSDPTGGSKEFTVDKDVFAPSENEDNQDGEFIDHGEPVEPEKKKAADSQTGKEATSQPAKEADKKSEKTEKTEKKTETPATDTKPAAKDNKNEPSKGFLGLLSNLERDYTSAQRTWQSAKAHGYVDSRQKSELDRFCTNANKLVSESRLYSLTDDQKAKVNNISSLAGSIRRGLYGLQKKTRPENQEGVEI